MAVTRFDNGVACVLLDPTGEGASAPFFILARSMINEEIRCAISTGFGALPLPQGQLCPRLPLRPQRAAASSAHQLQAH